jgi:hypothetical protein
MGSLETRFNDVGGSARATRRFPVPKSDEDMTEAQEAGLDCEISRLGVFFVD